eukprot:11711042-Karenia_brevis.AAC.1
MEATPVRSREEIQHNIIAQKSLATMTPEELRMEAKLPEEAIPLLNMISIMAKNAQQLERHQELQSGILGQHQHLITKLEETINEAKIRINGFHGDSFGLSAKCRRKVIQDMIWALDQNMWYELKDYIGQISLFDSR